MPSSTPNKGIPYPVPTDAVAELDDIGQDLAERLDLLMGETGLATITPSAANVDTTLRVNYARSYAALPSVPRVHTELRETIGTGTIVLLFADGEDATGFTLHIRSSNTSARNVRWWCKP